MAGEDVGKDEIDFPSFNCPFYPDGTQRQSFIDYGSIGAYDIDINEDNSLTIRSKFRHHSPSPFIGSHATVPLQRPCKIVFPCRNLPDIQVRNNKCRTDFKPTLVKQISDFYRNYPDITIPSCRDIINEELDCEPWDLGRLPAKTNSRLGRLNADGKRRAVLDPKYNIESFCERLVSVPLKVHAGVPFDRDKTHERYVPKGLPKALEDVPPQLLFDVMNESIEEIKDELLYFDVLQGNTIAYCNLLSLEDNAISGLLFHPSGPTLETMNLKFVKFNNVNTNHEGECASLAKPGLIESSTDVTVNGAIRQIEACYHEYSGVFVASRSRYGCSFFQTRPTEDISKATLSRIDSFESEVEIVNMTLSPFIPGDAIIITKPGQIHVQKYSQKVDVLDVPSAAPAEKWPWYQCVYAGHPRVIVIANPVEADILDLRANGSSSRTFFSIKSKEVSIHERISAVQRHPGNTHHYFIATDQSLMIMDDRFVQHPVLKWQHHLQDPVQFIEVVPNLSPDCNDTVVMVTGSYHREIHGYQYCNGEQEVSSSWTLMTNKVVTPPVSTSLPWKVSSYDEWPALLPISTLPLSSVLKDRLMNPVIGVCCIPAPTLQRKGQFSVLQMSAPGDMFYQPFTLNGRKKDNSRLSDRENRQTTPVSMSNPPDEEITFCKEWIQNLLAMEQQDDGISNWELNSNILEADCVRQFEAMISLESPHPSCSLCTYNDGGIPASVCDSEVSVCPRCGIDVKIGIELQKSKKQNTVAHSGACTHEKLSSTLNIFTNANEFQDTVSRGFLENWISDEPTPLELLDRTDEEGKDNGNKSTTNDTKDNQENSKLKIVQSEPKSSNEILEAKTHVSDFFTSVTKEVIMHPTTSNISIGTSHPVASNVSIASSHPMTSNVSIATCHPMTSNASIATSHPMTSNVSIGTSHPMTSNVSIATSHPMTSNDSIATSHPMTSTVSIAMSHPMTSNVSIATSHPMTSNVSMATSHPMTSNVSIATSQPSTSSVSLVASHPITSTVSLVASQPITSSVSIVTSEPIKSSVSILTTEPKVNTLSPIKKTKKRKLDLSMGF